MSDRLQPVDSTLDDELTDWIIAHDRGLTGQEQVAFDRWLQTSAAHGRAWSEAAALWEAFDHPGNDDRLADMLDEARQAGPRTSRFHYWRPVAIGGSLVLTAVLAWISVMPRHDAPFATQPPQARQYTAQYQAASFTLADGTHLTLDAGSSVSFASLSGARTATLKSGRAYIEVSHDPRRPFRVLAGGATITDVGTQFGIAANDHGLTVTLVEGRVRIDDPATGPKSVDLTPGQQFTRTQNAPGTVAAVDPHDALSWRQGYLSFDRVHLPDAIAEMNRYSRSPIIVGDHELSGFLVSGRFKAGDPQRFAEILTLTYPVKTVTDAQGRTIIRLKR